MSTIVLIPGAMHGAWVFEPLIAALKVADKDSRTKYLEALTNGIGTEGLVLALASSSDDEKLAYGRPVGVAIGADGRSLLVADDVGDVIWRVTG